MTGRSRQDTVEKSSAGRRLAALGLVFALLTMPVSYRAGTEVAHPHSFLHFLSDAAAGSMNHHLQLAGGQAEVAVRSPISLSAASIGAPMLDQLGPVNERISALGIALFAAWLSWAATRSVRSGSESRLTGLAPRPPAPPPRFFGSAV